MSWLAITKILGGVGLFVLGMNMLTDGLRLLTGKALRNVLARWTNTPLRGISTGVLITSLVHSSGAVTVATIGFVNAGLMTLTQAAFVIYGSNVGSTMTGWLVALIGINFNLDAVALSVIGVGMAVRILLAGRRWSHLGDVLAGTGLFFLGVDVLKSVFASVGTDWFHWSGLATGLAANAVLVGIGFVMTVLLQSSSAALMMILTAAAGNLISLEVGMAMIVGANVGTTTTAALAAIGATASARRAAAIHVLFNLITGIIVFAALPLLFAVVAQLRHSVGLAQQPATVLALFHSFFNVMGVVIMWPLNGYVVRQLGRWIHTAAEDEATPRYLDKNVLASPLVAMQALSKELGRIGELARRMSRSAISTEVAANPHQREDRNSIDRLVDAVGEFSTLLQRMHLPPELDELLPGGLRVSRYYSEQAQLAEDVIEAQSGYEEIRDPELAAEIASFKSAVVEFLDQTNVSLPQFSQPEMAATLAQILARYQVVKGHLLRAGAEGRIGVRHMVEELDLLSNIRRIAEQAKKAADYLALFETRAQANGSAEAAQSVAS